jgi:hypothetical protein
MGTSGIAPDVTGTGSPSPDTSVSPQASASPQAIVSSQPSASSPVQASAVPGSALIGWLLSL